MPKWTTCPPPRHRHEPSPLLWPMERQLGRLTITEMFIAHRGRTHLFCKVSSRHGATWHRRVTTNPTRSVEASSC